jgi:hypothetical protein
MIGNRKNMDDTFFRDLTVCVLDTLEGSLRWVNRFSSGDYAVEVPMYYSMTGDERFLLDSFQDDIASGSRKVELNTDIIPRGHISLKSFNVRSDEFANPNVWLRTVVENKIEVRKTLNRVRAVPVSVLYDLEITLANEIDTFKCSQALLDTLWLYRFMYFEHNYMNIDAVLLTPDESNIEITREKDLSSSNEIKMSISFEVQTYYPAFRKDKIDTPGYTKEGDGMTDQNGYQTTGGYSDYFSPDQDFVGNPGGKGSFTDKSSWPYVNSEDGYSISPKKSKWYNNILKARERNAPQDSNPNGESPSDRQNNK